MPTQLKIVALDGFNQNAPFTVNFATPVIIKPGQKIALDKFTAAVNGITTGFYIAPNTSFDMYLAVNSLTYAFVTINVPSKIYKTVPELLAALTTVCNNGITAYLSDVYPQTGLTRYYRDRGLKVVCGTNNNAFEFQFLTVAPTTVNLAATGMSTTTGNPPFYYPSAGAGVLNWSAKTPTLFPYLLNGGGASVEFQFYPSVVTDATANSLNFSLGLVDNFGKFHGLCQNAASQYSLSLINENAPAGQQVTQINPAFFPNDPTVFCQLYLVNGNFTLRSFRRAVDGTETDLFNSKLNPNLQNSMGAIDYTQTYLFQMVGSSQTINPTKTPAISNKISITCDLGFSTGGAPPPANATPPPISPPGTGTVVTRTMALDFTAAGSLRAGFGIPLGQVILTPNNSWWGDYYSSSAINMSVVQSTFDLALEILDIPLQSFVGTSDGLPGSRTNVLAYFHPELSSIGTGIYVYDCKAYQWLDIDISYPLNLSSMSFRVFNPDNNLPLNAQSMSFNLMINDKEY